MPIEPAKVIATAGSALATAIPVAAPEILAVTAVASAVVAEATEAGLLEHARDAIAEWRDGEHDTEADIAAGLDVMVAVLDSIPGIPDNVIETIGHYPEAVAAQVARLLRAGAGRRADKKAARTAANLRRLRGSRRVLSPTAPTYAAVNRALLPRSVADRIEAARLAAIKQGAPIDNRPAHTIGDGYLSAPDSDAAPATGWEPVVDEVVEVSPPMPDPVEEVPPVPALRPLAGVARYILAAHADGIDRPGCDVAAVIVAADEAARKLDDERKPACWSFTPSQVRKIEGARPGWLASLAGYGIRVGPREPHDGQGTLADSIAALEAAGVFPPARWIGSCLNPADYAAGPLPIVTGAGSLGHTSDPEWSGVKRLSPTVVLVGSGTADSVAIKRGIARDIAHGARVWAIEVVMSNLCDPKTGAPPYVASPARHDGAQAPVPILDDIARVEADIAADGASSVVMWTDYDEAVAAWQAGGEPESYVVPKS